MRLSTALLTAVVSAYAQSPAQVPAEKPLVRVTVELVQVDAVVTDSAGNHVTDLKPEEFDIRENGKPRSITNFSFIAGATPAVEPFTPVAPPVGKRAPPPPPVAPVRIAPGQATRTVAIVVDDLGISEQSFAALRQALERLVEQQVQPGDLMAIVTTSGRLGALQRLSSDTRLIRAALNRFRSIPHHRLGVLDDDFCGQLPIRAEYYSRLSVSAIRRVVDGMRELPGRKSILLLSEGVPLVRPALGGVTNDLLIAEFESLLTHANRSGVTINTIDPRRLIASFQESTAEQRLWDPGCEGSRKQELINTQAALAEMARRTGGISVADENDLSVAIGRVMSDQTGYYLIAFKPAGPALGGANRSPRFRNISIRVRRSGLKVRFHSSLYEEEEKQPAPVGSSRRLADAVLSPFSVPDIRVRFSSRFWDAGATAGSILETVLQIDARDLVFSQGTDGRRKAVFDILAAVYGAEDKPVDTFERSYTVSLLPSAHERALAEGLVQRLQLPVKKPGAYQIRGAVRDRQAGRIGSAGEFVEVPDLRRGGLALSGISLRGRGDSGDSAEAADVLRCRRGQTVFYAYQVLNAQPDREGSVNVEVRAALYREGRVLGTSAPVVVDAKDQPDRKRLVATGDFHLGKQLSPGNYTLQVTAVDKNAPAKRSTAAQAVDFEVIE